MGEYDTGTGTTDTSSSTAESETTARTGATGTGYDAQSASLRPTEANVQYEAGVDIDADADVDADAAADAQDAFMSRPYAVTDFVPSTGMGKFDAFYDPVAGQLTITVKVHFDYTLEAGA